MELVQKEPSPMELPRVTPATDGKAQPGLANSFEESRPVSSGEAGSPKMKVKYAERLVQPSDDVYDTTTDPPGCVLLLTYRTFSQPTLVKRVGAEHDASNLVNLFTQMGYDVESHMDKTKEQSISILKDFSSPEHLSKVGCAIVVVSSHGGEVQEEPSPMELHCVTPATDGKAQPGLANTLEESRPDSSGVTDPSKLKVKYTERLVQPSDDVYDTTTDPPGRVLLLTYKTFTNHKPRDGAEHDDSNLDSLFTQMGYDVESHMDKTYKESMSILQAFSNAEHLSDVGCAIVVVSSHGGKTSSSFCTSDGEQISVDYIHGLFTNSKSQKVIAMPKLFLFSFCRGDFHPKYQTDSYAPTPNHMISFLAPLNTLSATWIPRAAASSYQSGARCWPRAPGKTAWRISSGRCRGSTLERNWVPRQRCGISASKRNSTSTLDLQSCKSVVLDLGHAYLYVREIFEVRNSFQNTECFQIAVKILF